MVVKVVLEGNFMSENHSSLTLNATLDTTPTVSYLEPDVRSYLRCDTEENLIKVSAVR